MTAAFASDQRQENRAEQLESLRRQMSRVSEKVSRKAARHHRVGVAGRVAGGFLRRACGQPGTRGRACG